MTSNLNFPALLHSVSYSGSWGQAFLPLDRFVDKAAELGYDGVMLTAKRPHLSLLDYDRRRRAALRARLEQRRLTHVCVAGYNNFTADLQHSDDPQQEIQVHYITELARLTADLGGSLLRVFTGYEEAVAPFAAQWDRVVKALQECARRAADFGVTVGVQNHHDIATAFESHFELIRAVGEPNCKAMFDAWAPALHGADLAAAARAMGAITVHTTAANYQRLPRYHYQPGLTNYAPAVPWMQAVPIDEGCIDYREFLCSLSEGGFRGTVGYEICSPVRGGGGIENLDLYARRFIEFAAALRHELQPVGD